MRRRVQVMSALGLRNQARASAIIAEARRLSGKP